MKRKTLLLLVIFITVSFSIEAALKEEDIKVYKLENGLKVMLLEDHDIPNIAMYTFFRVGSRNERIGLTGVSHFIEHMMFNGTEKIGPGEFDRKMEFMGGANNAYTGEDLTAYTDWFPKEAMEDMIIMEADRIQGLLFDPQVLEQERGVIASERRLSDNNNERILAEQVQATAIIAHPYHWSVIGWMSDILNWKRDDIVDYYRKFYSPNNAHIVIVGDFNTNETLELIKKYYSSIPVGPKASEVTTVEPEQMGPKRVVINKESQTPSFLIAYHVPGCNEKDYKPLSILDYVMINGESSRLYKKLVREEQLAIGVSGGMSESIDPYLFFIRVKPKTNADLLKIEKIIEEEFEKVKKDGITERELQKAINIIRSNYYSSLQTIAGKANEIGQTELFYGDYKKLFTQMAEYRKIKVNDIKEVTAKYINENDKTVGTLVPVGGEK